MYVMFSKVPRSFAVRGIRMRRDVPYGRHRCVVDLTHLPHRQESPVVPIPGFERLPVDPSRSIGVTLYLVVLLQRSRPDSPPLVQQQLHLAKDQSVALQCSRVMSLQVPDVVPDRLRLARVRQATVSLVQLSQSLVEPLVDNSPARPPPAHLKPPYSKVDNPIQELIELIK
jgi:hypothetical protein